MARYLYKIAGAAPFDGSFHADTLAAAKCDAIRLAGERLCDMAEVFWNSADFKMTVTDEEGLVLFSLQLIATAAPSIMLSGDGISH